MSWSCLFYCAEFPTGVVPTQIFGCLLPKWGVKLVAVLVLRAKTVAKGLEFGLCLAGSLGKF